MPFICNLCDSQELISDARAFQMHFKYVRAHRLNFLYICTCGKPFSEFKNLREHFVLQHQELARGVLFEIDPFLNDNNLNNELNGLDRFESSLSSLNNVCLRNEETFFDLNLDSNLYEYETAFFEFKKC